MGHRQQHLNKGANADRKRVRHLNTGGLSDLDIEMGALKDNEEHWDKRLQGEHIQNMTLSRTLIFMGKRKGLMATFR